MILPLTPVRFKQRAAQLFGRKIGVVCGEKRFTYQKFNERCDSLSAALLRLGVKAGDRVAFLGYNCHRLLEATYAVPQTGGVLLPLNVRLTTAELAQIFADATPRIFFFDPQFASVVETLANGPVFPDRVMCLDIPCPEWSTGKTYEQLIESSEPRAFDWTRIDENSVAELFYTSGTTAVPKGVMLTHRNLYLHALYVAHAQRLGDDEVGAYAVPLFHVNSWGTPHTMTLSGARHVILPKFTPPALLDLIQTEGVTRLQIVPTMAAALIHYAGFEQYDVSSLREVMIGGAPSNVSLIREVEQKFPRAVVAGGYGLTETSPVSTIAYIKDHLKREPDEIQIQRKATAGYTVAGTEARLVDAEGRDVPADGRTMGELLIRSDTVMAGYRNHPQETMEALRGGWLHTGDLATIDEEGYILIVDRLKDMVLSGGENIATAEVERVIQQHPAVLECAVIGVPDEHWGEVPKALVALRPGSTATTQEIISHCQRQLAGYKVPKSVEFLETLPKGATGKILKRELRARYWAGRERQVN